MDFPDLWKLHRDSGSVPSDTVNPNGLLFPGMQDRRLGPASGCDGRLQLRGFLLSRLSFL
jgi:hypothetical protein